MGNHDGVGRAVDMSNPAAEASDKDASGQGSDAPQTAADSARNPADAPPGSTSASSAAGKPESSDLEMVMESAKTRKTKESKSGSSGDDNDLDNLLEGLSERYTGPSDETSSGPSSMEEFGEPAQKATVRDLDDARSSSSDFEFEELATGRMRVPDTGPDPGPDESTFAPSASATQRMAVSSTDVAVEEASTSEVLTVIGGASDRLTVHPGEQPVAGPSAWFPLSDDSDERVPMLPDRAKGEDSLVEPYGLPTAKRGDRIPMRPDPAKGEDSLVEPYGTPVSNAGERIRMVPLPGVPDIGSVLESLGMPALGAAERIGIWPISPQAGTPSGTDPYGDPSPKAAKRIELHTQPDLDAAGNVLEPYGDPSKNSGERMGLEPVSSAAGEAQSPLEPVADTSGIRKDRVSLLAQPDLSAGNSVETYGHPSQQSGQRTSLEPGSSGGGPDSENVLESYGSPAGNPADRFDLREQPDLDAGRSMETFGHPSRQSSSRTPTIPQPDAEALEQANVLESYGTPTRNVGDRFDIHEKPDLEAGKSVEPVGHPSVTHRDRSPISPEPDAAALDEALTLGRYGDPTAKSSDRVELVPLSKARSGCSIEKYGKPHTTRSERMDLDPEPVFEPDSSSLKPVGNPLKDSTARIDLEDKPQVDCENSTMNSATRTSKDCSDRMGRIDHDAIELDDDQSAAALKLSTDAADRFGYVDQSVSKPSPLPDIGTPSMLEAGRVPVKPFENHIRSAVPNGLEGLMPDPRLRGHDRMRLTEYEEYELPPELVGKIPIPPRIVQVEGSLPEAERYGACGDERVLKKEVTHRRMDFLYQRYEELHVRRRYYHCPFTPEEPVYKCREPRFVAGLAPLGNGLLAQLLASIYDDHSNVTDQAGILDRLGFTLAEKHIETGIDNATAAIQPILEALHKEFKSGDGRPGVDKKIVDSAYPGPKNRPAEGQLLFASRTDAKILIHLKSGENHPLIKDMPPSRRKGELIQDLFRERVGYNREGIWAGVRRRFTLALATSPREAAYALFLIHAITAAANPTHGQHDELVRRSRALRAWLDDQREQFEDPDNPLQRAVVYTLSSWDRMRFVDDSGDGSAIQPPEARGFPKNYVPLWTFDSEAQIARATTWYSLIHTCRLLGIRPWEYLFDCFSALSKQQVTQPEKWTPAAWARATQG